VNEENPFLQSKTPNQATLFGQKDNIDNNQNTPKSLFGNSGNLFGNNPKVNSLFG
jgi:hypothetical protein